MLEPYNSTQHQCNAHIGNRAFVPAFPVQLKVIRLSAAVRHQCSAHSPHPPSFNVPATHQHYDRLSYLQHPGVFDVLKYTMPEQHKVKFGGEKEPLPEPDSTKELIPTQ